MKGRRRGVEGAEPPLRAPTTTDRSVGDVVLFRGPLASAPPASPREEIAAAGRRGGASARAPARAVRGSIDSRALSTTLWLKWWGSASRSRRPPLDRRQRHRAGRPLPARPRRRAGSATAASSAIVWCWKSCCGVSAMPAARARGDDLDAEDRVAAELEEVVVDADPLEPQHLAQIAAERLLRPRRAARVRRSRRPDAGVGRGQRPAVHLAARRERQRVEQTKADGTM